MTRALATQIVLLLLLYAPVQGAQESDPESPSVNQSMTFKTDAVEPNHFVAVHGRRSIIMGYPQKGLEIWGYPFQILSDYQIGFKPSGATATTDGRLLLRRVDYRPDTITRTYIGPDYLVREKLFVPLDQAAAVISYEVEGIRQVEIEVYFLPVLNLMWPAALGGQYTRWSGAASAGDVPGFVISEPGRGFSAAIGSREIIDHEDTVNSTVHSENSLSFSLRPAVSKLGTPAKAIVYVALNPAGTKHASQALQTLSIELPKLATEAKAHYAALERNSLRLRTPDENVNRSLAWSLVALDQAWVCNPLLGCGMVAGYGPSRDARRPQYDWFFGGDGLVATNALVSAGEYSRAREELSFVQKYQDPASGMIWHELSQSAGFIDWSKYPYMFVHVDISFDYLATLARYVAVSGDVEFARERWASIAAAYRYCQSQIQGSDHLPHIAADKEASDEQHRPADDLGLAASWMAAASGFAELARLTSHTEQLEAALKAVQLTRLSIPAHYWNADRNFWFDGHTQSGEPIFRQAAGPTQLLIQNVFSPQQTESLLDQLTSADFQADWGTRQVAASSKDYNPYSYGAGSISALGTSGVATTFWQAHRPESAIGLWNGIMQWNILDSFGHIHEVLAGNFFQEQTESVPEQTWSSAGLLDGTVRGLLGLEINGVANRFQLAPHIPAGWNQVSVENIRLPHSVLTVKVSQSIKSFDLDISNQGIATTMALEPEIPLGAHLTQADLNGQRVNAATESFSGDEHVKLTLAIPSGASHCHLGFDGGVAILLTHPALHIGDPSSELKIVKVALHQHVLWIEADVHARSNSKCRIRTPWRITAHRGATVRSLSDNDYEIDMAREPGPESFGPTGYARAHSEITFAY
jgi:glycogen debranching enzyme